MSMKGIVSECIPSEKLNMKKAIRALVWNAGDPELILISTVSIRSFSSECASTFLAFAGGSSSNIL